VTISANGQWELLPLPRLLRRRSDFRIRFASGAHGKPTARRYDAVSG
jgi:hypothetical protein